MEGLDMDRRAFMGGLGMAAAGLAVKAGETGHELVLKDVRALIGGGFKPCDLGVSGGRIARIAEPGTLASAGQVIAGAGLYLSPGWGDLHVHYVDWKHLKSAGSS